MWSRTKCFYTLRSLKDLGPRTQRQASRSLHSGSWRLYHHHYHHYHHSGRTHGLANRAVRWYSQGKTGGGARGDKSSNRPPEGGGDTGGGGGGGGNFFQRLVENVRKEMKGGEVQESLKGFNEEREEMQQSYVVQQAKLKWSALMERMRSTASKSSEKTAEGWSVLRKTSSKASHESFIKRE